MPLFHHRVPDDPAQRPPRLRGDLLMRSSDALGIGVIVMDGYDPVRVSRAADEMHVVRDGRMTSAELLRLITDARDRNAQLQADLTIAWGNGQRLVRATAIPIDGGPLLILMLEDLVEKQRVESVRRDFVANVSHELKTPVGGLLLLAEAVRDAADDPPTVRHFADQMVSEASRLSKLVQELIDLSRLQGGEPLPDTKPVAVTDLVSAAIGRVTLAAERSGITLEVGQIPPDLEIRGDLGSLVTALTNLLDNAIAYSNQGTKVAIGVAVNRQAALGEIEISVTDQGIGIPAADQSRVFERFYRADPARSRSTGGTGLGLSIVKHIAQNHGGAVTLWSAPGVGSTFTLHLPAMTKGEQ